MVIVLALGVDYLILINYDVFNLLGALGGDDAQETSFEVNEDVV